MENGVKLRGNIKIVILSVFLDNLIIIESHEDMPSTLIYFSITVNIPTHIGVTPPMTTGYVMNTDPGPYGGLSTRAIIGIAVSILAVFIAIIVVIILLFILYGRCKFYFDILAFIC